MITNIEIKGAQHPMVYGYGALMIAEEILGEAWGTKSTAKSSVVLLYACMLNGDNDFPYEFDAFLRLVDTEDGLLDSLNTALAVQVARWGKPKEGPSDDDKKKD